MGKYLLVDDLLHTHTPCRRVYAILSSEWLVIVTKCPWSEVHSTLTDLSMVPW